MRKFLLGLVLGFLALVGARYVFMPPQLATHFHANFAVFIQGKRVDFSGDQYMEDIQGCKLSNTLLQPEERTHMHNNVSDVVHVHDHGVTWGHFFANIGFTFDQIHLMTDEGKAYSNDVSNTLKFILNDEPVPNPYNRLIASEDRFLISYGPEAPEELMGSEWLDIADTAAGHNEHPDPGSCSGEIPLDFWVKLKKAVWF